MATGTGMKSSLSVSEYSKGKPILSPDQMVRCSLALVVASSLPKATAQPGHGGEEFHFGNLLMLLALLGYSVLVIGVTLGMLRWWYRNLQPGVREEAQPLLNGYQPQQLPTPRQGREPPWRRSQSSSSSSSSTLRQRRVTRSNDWDDWMEEDRGSLWEPPGGFDDWNQAQGIWTDPGPPNPEWENEDDWEENPDNWEDPATGEVTFQWDDGRTQTFPPSLQPIPESGDLEDPRGGKGYKGMSKGEQYERWRDEMEQQLQDEWVDENPMTKGKKGKGKGKGKVYRPGHGATRQPLSPWTPTTPKSPAPSNPTAPRTPSPASSAVSTLETPGTGGCTSVDSTDWGNQRWNGQGQRPGGGESSGHRGPSEERAQAGPREPAEARDQGPLTVFSQAPQQQAEQEEGAQAQGPAEPQEPAGLQEQADLPGGAPVASAAAAPTGGSSAASVNEADVPAGEVPAGGQPQPAVDPPPMPVFATQTGTVYHARRNCGKLRAARLVYEFGCCMECSGPNYRLPALLELWRWEPLPCAKAWGWTVHQVRTVLSTLCRMWLHQNYTDWFPLGVAISACVLRGACKSASSKPKGCLASAKGGVRMAVFQSWL